MGPEFAAPASPIVSAVSWVEQLLLGSVATAIAVIAVAVVGAAMLTGRANWRRGASIVAGCFIIFGASALAGGLAEPSGVAATTDAVETPESVPLAPPQASAGYDPYAGAALALRPNSKELVRDRIPGSPESRVPPRWKSRLDVPSVIR